MSSPASIKGHPIHLLTLIGVALISVSGWLGGETVYVHGVAVTRPGPNA
jgi:uncharacterized membrane protein